MKTTRYFGLACILTTAMSAACGAPAGEDNVGTESAKILADINAAPVLHANVAAGYTIATSLQVGNVALPYFLLYNAATGAAVYEYLTPGAGSLQRVGSYGYMAGWSTITAFAGYDGQAYLLFYNKLNGAVYIEKVNANAAGMTYVWSGTWDKGWTALATYQDPSSGAPKLIAYNGASGAVQLDDINASYNGTTTRYAATWPKYMKDVVPYRAGIQQRVFTTPSSAASLSGNGNAIISGIAWTGDSMFEIGSQAFNATASASYWPDNGVPRFSSVDSWSGMTTLNEFTSRGYAVDETSPSSSWQGIGQLVLRSGTNVYQMSYLDFGAGIGGAITIHLLSTSS